RPGADSKAVVIYTTTWCPYCAKLRSSLAASGIPYLEHDVEKSLQGQIGFWTLRGCGIPVSAIGPKIIYGYDVARIAFALKDWATRSFPCPIRSRPATRSRARTVLRSAVPSNRTAGEQFRSHVSAA
ncbi:MAG TPA: glutaredoxin domain-containing protein, partial [Burkholderiales bacterium]|nr:glutaredoxin domain-containing protein [Burkholderiales bacterium]